METSAELQCSDWYTNMLVETSAELQCSGWYTLLCSVVVGTG